MSHPYFRNRQWSPSGGWKAVVHGVEVVGRTFEGLVEEVRKVCEANGWEVEGSGVLAEKVCIGDASGRLCWPEEMRRRIDSGGGGAYGRSVGRVRVGGPVVVRESVGGCGSCRKGRVR